LDATDLRVCVGGIVDLSGVSVSVSGAKPLVAPVFKLVPAQANVGVPVTGILDNAGVGTPNVKVS
jgi:hypothetical protein